MKIYGFSKHVGLCCLQAALEMRTDLKHWDEAMKLAEQLDPSSIGSISRQYAGMLEVRGDFSTALDYYQQVCCTDHMSHQTPICVAVMLTLSL